MVEITAAGPSGSASGSKTLTALKVLKKVIQHTGKAAWIFGTTVLVLGVPLIIEMDREQQLVEMENQQMGVLSGGAPGAPVAPAPAK
mmetsp:Transcript_36352/g.43990  ORF Transcript_36352/g.43990 Transcript_36352/m.43990 type:complete len:87 (+) Transcript_36352:76-336(+)